jgi:glutathione S-transferase
MSDLILYTNPMSRGRIVHWMMEEIGEPYDTVWLDYGHQMKSEDFLAINPMGKIPTLQHQDQVVTEAGAICAYLAAIFPDKGLIPAHDDPALASFYRWLFFAAGPLEQDVMVQSMDWIVPEEKQRSVGFGSHEHVMEALEVALSNGLFVCGEQFTAADVYLGSHLNWGMIFGGVDARPSIVAYVERLMSRPAALRADKINEDRIAQQS